MGSYLECVSFG